MTYHHFGFETFQMTYLPSYAKDSSWTCPHVAAASLIEKCLFLKLFLQPAGRQQSFSGCSFCHQFSADFSLGLDAKTKSWSLHMVFSISRAWGVNFQLRTARFWIDLLHSPPPEFAASIGWQLHEIYFLQHRATNQGLHPRQEYVYARSWIQIDAQLILDYVTIKHLYEFSGNKEQRHPRSLFSSQPSWAPPAVLEREA